MATENKENLVVAPATADLTAKNNATTRKAVTTPNTKTPVPIGTPHDENEYKNLIQKILDEGDVRDDRTGTGTISLFGAQMRFNIQYSFPLLTTKRVFWRGVLEELLWFIKGSTNANLLAEKNVRIWDGNGSREFLDSRGLTNNQVGDLGPVYGFQWRHFGAEYKTCHDDYTNQGVDQLKHVIDTIRTNPTCRRIIMNAWNCNDLNKMALPPCHIMCQFYVNQKKNTLSCQMYQRSADMGLGVPFNIASYSLLTYMIAYITGYQPGEFVHCIGDAHVYKNHVEPLKLQLERQPYEFPTLEILRSRDEIKEIDDFVYEDFKIVGYKCHPTIKMDMAV